MKQYTFSIFCAFSLLVIIPFLMFASTDNSSSMLLQTIMNTRNTDLKSIEMNADLTVTMQGQTNNAQCEFIMLGKDSLSMHITGPFGFSVAKLFASSEYFLFLDNLQGRAIEGIPNADNLSKATFIPLSFNDYVSLLRAEIPGNAAEYIRISDYADSTSILYKRPHSLGGIEFVLCTKTDGLIKQYQRKNAEGITEISVLYSGYQLYDSIMIPKNVILSVPIKEIIMKIEAQDIKVNNQISTSMRFNVPSSINILKME